MLTGVDQSWNALEAQLLVLLVNRATVDVGVDQSCNRFAAQFDVLLENVAYK